MLGILDAFSRRKSVHCVSLDRLSRRALTTWDLVSLSIGATLGTGIYIVVGHVSAIQAGPAVILSFTIAVIAAILSGLCYAEFAARMPNTTGSAAYTFAYVTVGELPAFLIGWNLILKHMIGSAATARALSQCFDYVIGNGIRRFTLTHIGTLRFSIFGGTYPDFLAFFLTLLVVGVLSAGVKQSWVCNTVFNMVNLSVVGFIIIAGSFYVKRENWALTYGFFPYGASGVWAGAATCFYAFVGFDVITSTGHNTKNPQRAIPLSIMISLFIVFMCYISVSAILTLILPYISLNVLAPIPAAFSQRGFHVATYIIGVGALCGLGSSLQALLCPLPRIVHVMASDGLLFKIFHKKDQKFEVSLTSTLLPGLMTSLLALVSDLRGLLELVSLGTLLAYTLISLSVLIVPYQPRNTSSGSADFHDFGRDLVTESESEHSKDESQEFRELEKLVNQGGEEEMMLKDNLDDDGSVENIVSYPTKQSGRIVTWAALTLFISVFIFLSLMIHALDLILAKNAPVVALTLVLGFLCLFCIGVIAGMPQNTRQTSFRVPCAPAVPILAMFVNVALMLKLSRDTWVRFLIWIAIGLVIYLFYGLRHSLARSRTRTRATMSAYTPRGILARNACEFSYDLDVIPAHRDLSAGKRTPISPIFWTSILNYHFFADNFNNGPPSP